MDRIRTASPAARIGVLVVLVVAAPFAAATTWTPIEVPDPLLEGEVCEVQTPMSWGGYVYRWNSKYDLVFWPYTVSPGIWYCAGSGFTALIDDFDEISTEELDRIRAWLARSRPDGDALESRLRLLEGIYAQRALDPEFENRLLRILARWYQDLERFEAADAYRRRALDHLEARLEGELEPIARLEYLYVAANYTRHFGDTARSDAYLERLQLALSEVTDPELEGFVDYLTDLVQETVRITPGGMLDPPRPGD